MYFLKLIFLREDVSNGKDLFVCADPTLPIPVNPECLLYERKSGLVAGQLACHQENCFSTSSTSWVSSVGHIQGNPKPSNKEETWIPFLRIPVVTGCGLHQPKEWILSGSPHLWPPLKSKAGPLYPGPALFQSAACSCCNIRLEMAWWTPAPSTYAVTDPCTGIVPLNQSRSHTSRWVCHNCCGMAWVTWIPCLLCIIAPCGFVLSSSLALAQQLYSHISFV